LSDAEHQGRHSQYEYNLDKQLIQIRRPDGQVIDLVYDSFKKRLNRMDLPNDKSLNYAYNALTGKLEMITAPDGSSLSYTYDGSLALSETWGNGDITGTLSLDYNNDFRVTAISINDNPVNYQYDNDGLLTNAGDLSLTHHGQNGLLEATQLGNISTERTHNTFGEMASYVGRVSFFCKAKKRNPTFSTHPTLAMSPKSLTLCNRVRNILAMPLVESWCKSCPIIGKLSMNTTKTATSLP
jgi:YD repeat-containing protein